VGGKKACLKVPGYIFKRWGSISSVQRVSKKKGYVKEKKKKKNEGNREAQARQRTRHCS